MGELFQFSDRVPRQQYPLLDKPFMPAGNPKLLQLVSAYSPHPITHMGHVIQLTEESVLEKTDASTLEALKSRLECHGLHLGMDVPSDWKAPHLISHPPRRG